MAGDLWNIRRDGSKTIGPVTTELVVRGLMAGKIPHDCEVQKKGETKWTSILEVDAFHDATQATTVQAVARHSAAEAATTMMERPPDMEEGGPEIPAEALALLGRAWHAPEWMLILPGDIDMRGPYTLSEVKSRIEAETIDGAQVCRMRTFDWMPVEEAFEQAGEAPLLVPSSMKIRLDSAPPKGAVGGDSDDPNRPVDWTKPLFRVMHLGELQGPTSLEQIERALSGGRLSPDDEISGLDAAAFLPLGPFLDDARKRKVEQHTVIVARRLGTDPTPGIPLGKGKWATWVVLAAIAFGLIFLVILRAMR